MLRDATVGGLGRLRPLADAWATRLERIVAAKPAEVRRLRAAR